MIMETRIDGQRPFVVSASLNELIRSSEDARSLQLRPRHIGARQGGQYVSRLRGRGMEFEESRPYQPGDDVRNMDWRVTARTGKAHSKVFREERERPVLLSVDLRAAMWFATRGRFKAAQAQNLAALFAWVAVQGGDRIGGEIYQERQHWELRPRRGKKAALHFLNQLLRPEPIWLTDVMPSMEGTFKRMRRTAHPGSLVVFISDFRGFDQSCEHQLARIARHNDVILVHVYDAFEAALPEQGYFRLSDGRRIVELNASNAQLRARYRHDYQARITGLKQLCLRRHLTWMECATDLRPIDALRPLFGKRQKQ